MLTFTLAVCCLTTSNLPWFMDLTFQVPMQYCSLQHQTLLPSPVTSTTGCCFCFGSIPSFFLELFLHWSPVAYWAPTGQGSSSFSVLSFLPVHSVHGVLKARIMKWFSIPFSSGPHSVRPLHHARLSWVAPNLHIWRFSVHALFSVHVVLKASLKLFEHYLGGTWNERNFMVVWTFLDIAFLWIVSVS